MAYRPQNIDQTRFNEVDDIRDSILDAVNDEDFDFAIRILEQFLEQPSEYPQFKIKMERMVTHCIHLINAIRAKKNFPGKSSLTRSKQQELSDKTKYHFAELESTLSKMEKIMVQFTKDDVRSTIWVIRAFVYSSGVILIAAFLIEMTTGYWGVFEKVMENQVNKGIDWIFPPEQSGP